MNYTAHPSARTLRFIMWFALSGLIATVLAIGALSLRSGQPAPPESTAVTSPSQAPEPSAPPVVPSPDPEPSSHASTFTIIGAGDVLPHMPVHRSARISDGYDFLPLLEGISPLIDSAAISLCHLEVPVASQEKGPTGYPLFGQAQQVVTALAQQGWDGCSTASNHSVDQGFAGVVRTIDALEDNGMGFAGTARTEQEDGPQYYVVRHGEFETVVAHLAYTQWLNGLPVPAGKPFSVNLTDAEHMIYDAAQARRVADIVVVSVHDGTEYQTAPNQSQIDLAQTLAHSGLVDLFIGHHAHVPQPMTKLVGGPGNRGMWTAYGLGNMISNQNEVSCCVPQTATGLMMFAEVTRDGDAPAQVTSLSWRALTVDHDAGHRLEDLSTLAHEGQAHGTLSAKQLATRYDLVVSAVGNEIPERRELIADDYESVHVVPRGSLP